MRGNFINYIFTIIIIVFSSNISFAEKYLEVKKLYELYSEKILNLDQLNSGLEKMNVNNINMKNLISLREEGIISENDFINGIKKIISNIELEKTAEEDNKSNVAASNTKKYEFQTEISIIHSFIISDFKYGEIWNHMIALDGEKIIEISFKDSKNNDLIKLTKPKFKNLKNNKFAIRSSAIYLPEPSVGIRYDFKGEFVNNKIVGEVEITYTESDEAGLVLLRAKTN